MPAPVYFSIVEIPGDGVTTQHEFSFDGGYISRDHVRAYTQDADGVITPVTVTPGMFVNDGTLALGVAAPVGGLTRIYRDTPKNEPLANFSGGARITEANLDLLAQQTIFGVAEAFDAGAYAQVNDLLGAAGAAAAAAAASAAESGDHAVAAAAALAATLIAQTAAEAAVVAAGLAADDSEDFAIAAAAQAAAASASAASAAGAAASAAAAAVANKVDKTSGPQVMTVDLTVPSLNGGQIGGSRRRNFNGDMRVAQTGSSFPTAAGHVIDGWRYFSSGGAVATVTRQAGGPPGVPYSLLAATTTPDAALAATDYSLLQTFCEGYDVADFVGRTFTVGFWVRSAKAGIHCCAIRNTGVDRSYVFEYTVNASNTWEFKEHTVVGGLPASGTWNFTNGTGLSLHFTLAVGSSYQTSPDAWQAGSFLGTANQVNLCDAVGDSLTLADVQVEPGEKATPYERGTVGAALIRAARYGRMNGALSGWSNTTTSVSGLSIDFSSNPMRTAPTPILWNGTNTVHEPGVGFRSMSSPIYAGSTLGGYLQVTSTPTTLNRLHNLLPSAVFFDARLV